MMSPRKGHTPIEVSRVDEVLTLRMARDGVVYELSEDIGLDRWEARHWEEGAEVADLNAGDGADRAMADFFPQGVDQEFRDELERRSVREARLEPLDRFRALIAQSRWHKASQLGICLALDPYVSSDRAGGSEFYAQLAQTAALVAANELSIRQAITEAERLGETGPFVDGSAG